MKQAQKNKNLHKILQLLQILIPKIAKVMNNNQKKMYNKLIILYKILKIRKILIQQIMKIQKN